MKPQIRPFKPSDTDRLSSLFPSDWHFDFPVFISLYGCTHFFHGFTMTLGKDVIGFGNLFIFDKMAWLGNIVIDTNYRNLGHGTYITKHLIDFGTSSGVLSFQLIATKLGEAVYNKLGFQTDENYHFFALKKTEVFTFNSASIIHCEKRHMEEILHLDVRLSGENRTELLRMHLNNAIIYFTDHVEGYFIPELGYGLIMADTIVAGQSLLSHKIKQGVNSVVCPQSNVHAVNLLTSIGFKQTASAPRMYFGEAINCRYNSIFARAAGYCG